jgi:hypothetical protein
MEEEETMLMETLQAVKDRTILKYVQETINNPIKEGRVFKPKKPADLKPPRPELSVDN